MCANFIKLVQPGGRDVYQNMRTDQFERDNTKLNTRLHDVETEAGSLKLVSHRPEDGKGDLIVFGLLELL
jgi:hypothetical protein